MATDDEHAAVIDRLDDLTRALKRQATGIERLADDARAREAKERAGADVPLLVDLFAVHSDANACAMTAETERERAAFEAIATSLERLIVGRGGEPVVPAPGVEFDPATMDAVEVRWTDTASQDRLVAEVLTPGLRVPTVGRTVRPARVVVYRHRT